MESRKVIVMYCFNARQKLHIENNCGHCCRGPFFPLKSFAELNIAIEKGDALDFIFQLLT